MSRPHNGCMRVLVVDDDPAVRRSLTNALRRDGMDVGEAEDGLSPLIACEPADYLSVQVKLHARTP